MIILPFSISLLGSEFTAEPPCPAGRYEEGYWVALVSDGVLLKPENSGLAVPHGRIPDSMQPVGDILEIGTWRGLPLRVFALEDKYVAVPPLVLEMFRTIGPCADDVTITVCGLARQLYQWHARSKYCPRCAGPTAWSGRGWGKRCGNCGNSEYPASSPCAIVLVTRGEELLLVRKPEWSDGRYSLPSGFAEPGESLEECAVREVREETGIEIAGLSFVASQSWPFPSQLMAGFQAEFAGGELSTASGELEDARWFSPHALPTLPSTRSIARYMIDRHCGRDGR